MNKNILVTCTTYSGSTREVAQAVGQALARNGAAVEVRAIKDVDGLDAYDAVVVGGPTIMVGIGKRSNSWNRTSEV